MDPFIGEIRLLPYTFAPQDWLFCYGQEFPIGQYQALYAVIGNIYGGTPSKTFKLPNLQGFIPVGANSTTVNTVLQLGLGKTAGAATETLSYNEYPTHNHTMYGLLTGTATNRLNQPTSNTRPSTVTLNGTATSGSAAQKVFSDVTTPNTVFAPQAISPNSTTYPEAHSNQQPYLPLHFMIATNGIFPIRS